MYLEKEIITSLPTNYLINRSPNYSLHSFDFDRLISGMKNEKKWKNGELNMIILLGNQTKKVILTVLHENTEIISDQVNDSITFTIIDGKLNLHFLNESIILNSGDFLTLKEKTAYRIISLEETAYIMTLKSGN